MSDETNVDATAPRCKCGYSLGNFWVRPEAQYGLMGTLGLIFGVTSLPSRVDYRCSHCRTVLKSLTESNELKDYLATQQKR